MFPSNSGQLAPSIAGHYGLALTPNIKIEPNKDNIGNTFKQSNTQLKTGYSLQLLATTVESICNSINNTGVQIIVQQNGENYRSIIQIGINSKEIQNAAGSSLLYKYNNDLSVKISIDEKHKDDPYTGYISINRNGQFVFTPKIYSEDKIELGIKNHFWSPFKSIGELDDPLKGSMILDSKYKNNLVNDIQEIIYNIK